MLDYICRHIKKWSKETLYYHWISGDSMWRFVVDEFALNEVSLLVIIPLLFHMFLWLPFDMCGSTAYDSALPHPRCIQIDLRLVWSQSKEIWWYYYYYWITRERGSVFGLGTMEQAGRSRVRIPVCQLNVFSIDPEPFSRTMTLGSTQPLTEMSIGNLPGAKLRRAREAGNLTAICKPTV
jgi:hypothetical protein